MFYHRKRPSRFSSYSHFSEKTEIFEVKISLDYVR